jgi:hypothetical protein
MEAYAPLLAPGGAAGLLLLTVLLIIYGKLVPARTVLSLMEGKDKIIESLQKTVDAYERQLDETTELALTVKKVLSALPVIVEDKAE